MIYVLYTDSTHRTSNAFTSRFSSKRDFLRSLEEGDGSYTAERISKERYIQIREAEKQEISS